jgi:hypothetical protein
MPGRAIRAMRQAENAKLNNSGYTADVGDEICRRLADGESLREICRGHDMPPESTVRQWAIDDRDGLAARYREARALLVERWADEIISIADDGQLEPNDRRVRVDTRKWLMSKLAPKRYGDRLLHGGDPNNPIRVEMPIDLERLSVAELDALARLTQARLQGTTVAGQ